MLPEPNFFSGDGTPESASHGDLAGVIELLRSADLPTSGVEDSFPAAYSILRAASGPIAVAGMECYGKHGLLRSVAVAASHRGLGLGRRMVEDRLSFALRNDLGAVYLLTTTAASFFRELGFEPVPRSSVPAAVQVSSEFTSVCPTTAACLMKELTPEARNRV